MLLEIPWWVYMAIVLIFFSGYMAFRAMRAERRLEQQFIEREGKVYMDRIEEKRDKKQDKNELMSG